MSGRRVGGVILLALAVSVAHSVTMRTVRPMGNGAIRAVLVRGRRPQTFELRVRALRACLVRAAASCKCINVHPGTVAMEAGQERVFRVASDETWIETDVVPGVYLHTGAGTVFVAVHE